MYLSFWLENNKKQNFKELEEGVEADVCVIGGGITGIACAYMLQNEGLKVTILEKNFIGSGTTGNTTAKITAGHALMYSKMMKDFGEEKAKLYLEANIKAIDNIETIINKEKIDCDFRKQNSYIYTEKSENVAAIEEEYEVVKELGANITKEIGNLPFPVLSAICYKNQAQFHVIKYINSLVEVLYRNKAQIYENTRVIEVKRNNYYEVVTDKGKVTAKHVILATHYPIINVPGYYFMKMYQERSYIIAIKTKATLPEGMYISAESPVKSFRMVDANNEQILLIGGNEHKTGKLLPDVNPYEELEKYAMKVYPDCEVLYRWSAQDAMPLDNAAYIGQYSVFTPNMYVATGFKKWGMTTSHIAAEIIRDKVLERENKYESVFTSTRINPAASAKEEIEILKETTKSLILKNIILPEETLNSINEDEGKVIEYENQKIGVYKDKNNKIYAVDAKCAHLGCELAFNNAEKTWDCPCHGSRFNINGENISEPAIYDIESYSL